MTELPVISTINTETSKFRKPDWLRVKLPIGENYKHVRDLVDTHKLHTICESGNCPNMGECWGEGTATFMILGNICTHICGFCAVATGRPEAVVGMNPTGGRSDLPDEGEACRTYFGGP
jgi:lipoic acid synthetase